MDQLLDHDAPKPKPARLFARLSLLFALLSVGITLVLIFTTPEKVMASDAVLPPAFPWLSQGLLLTVPLGLLCSLTSFLRREARAAGQVLGLSLNLLTAFLTSGPYLAALMLG